jgi:hypothetical protein
MKGGSSSRLGQFDAPAYIRRARRVDDALACLLERCGGQREKALKPVRHRLEVLESVAGGRDVLAALLSHPEPVDLIAELHQAGAELSARPASSRRTLQRAVAELNDSVQAFNRRWTRFLEQVDLGPVNDARAGYNRYYVLEKECAVRSVQVARQGFQPLPPLMLEELKERFPCLPILVLR